MATFDTVLNKERSRINKLKDAATERRNKIDEELASLDRELAAIDAYQMAKQGKGVGRGRRGGRAGGKRAPRGSRQQAVVDVVKDNAGGLSRGGILQAMGLKGNKSGEQSVSNALNALKKAGRLVSKNGLYTLGKV